MNRQNFKLTFKQFQEENRRRCEECFHSLGSWLPEGWALAIAGESGELCNFVKKIKRGDFSLEEKREDLLKELADIITYADLMISALGADTQMVLLDKFKEVSKRCGWLDVSTW